MSTDDDLRQILDETAAELARLSSNPRTWLSWMVYLLERLERQATNENPNHKDLYKDMIAALRMRSETG